MRGIFGMKQNRKSGILATVICCARRSLDELKNLIIQDMLV